MSFPVRPLRRDQSSRDKPDYHVDKFGNPKLPEDRSEKVAFCRAAFAGVESLDGGDLSNPHVILPIFHPGANAGDVARRDRSRRHAI
jgi:hypothetical protein